ncbi:MAG: response regulator [Melioribacteraceae bacterium]|nr:response regulator [Melioribacteraceae bacterium]MCF8356106.1 response regulator [Melioribacteraceae bacterium]MCF8395590.1 response regulator [Melioribacteraceae bacterium]MCF8419692.1 response regulator [Melioribacteraceae bacterium]
MESILIVDDDIQLCEVLNDELSEVGYNSNFVNNADEAINYLSQNRTDLVLLDLKMPEKDGFFVLSEINNRGINTKIIVLTAYADVKSAIDSARMGAADFVSKPYDLDELIITIRKVLNKEENGN